MGSGWLRVLVSGSGSELRFRGSGWSLVFGVGLRVLSFGFRVSVRLGVLGKV